MTHPLWPAFLAYDRQRHAGTPDLEDSHDRELWELFQHAHALGVTAGRQDAANELAILTANRDHYSRQSKRLKEERDAARSAMKDAWTAISRAEASFAGLALRLHPSDPGNDIVLEHTRTAQSILINHFQSSPVSPVNEVNPVQDAAPLIREDGSDDDFIRLHYQVMQEMLEEEPAASPTAPPHPPASTDDTPHSSAPESAPPAPSPAP